MDSLDRISKLQQKLSKKKQELRSIRMNYDRRFQQIIQEMERDKQIQIQIGIEKFKTSEFSRIREEIENELKFELLRKERELLANYDDKVNHLRNTFQKEKELWHAEKAAKENEILERRQELMFAIQSVNDLILKDNPKTEVTSSREDKGNKVQSNDIALDFNASTIAAQSDTIAFLQYQLECQNDEIEKLRTLVNENMVVGDSNVKNRDNSKASAVPKCLQYTDMDDFLREAKLRITGLEKEALLVEQSLVKLHATKTEIPDRYMEPLKARFVLPSPTRIAASLKEKASRSGALTKDKVDGNNGNGNGKHISPEYRDKAETRNLVEEKGPLPDQDQINQKEVDFQQISSEIQIDQKEVDNDIGVKNITSTLHSSIFAEEDDGPVRIGREQPSMEFWDL